MFKRCKALCEALSVDVKKVAQNTSKTNFVEFMN